MQMNALFCSETGVYQYPGVYVIKMAQKADTSVKNTSWWDW